MTTDELLDAIGEAQDSFVLDADQIKLPRKRSPWLPWLATAAACMTLVMMGGAVFSNIGGCGASPSTGEASYGNTAPSEEMQPDEEQAEAVPESSESDSAVSSSSASNLYAPLASANYVSQSSEPLTTDQTSAVARFAQITIPALLMNQEGNSVYSPAGLYLALSSLTDATAGDTQATLLNVLGETADTSATVSYHLWQQLYLEGDASRVLPLNSLWIDDSLQDALSPDIAQLLASDHYLSSNIFSADSGAAGLAMSQWLAENTGSVPSGQLEAVSSSEADQLLLCSALSLQSPWETPFSLDTTYVDSFTTRDGSVVSCDFMTGLISASYQASDRYQALSIPLECGQITLVLPGEGYTVDELLADGTCLEELLRTDSASTEYDNILCALPRFTISTTRNLNLLLSDLGLGALVDGTGDFTPLCYADASLTQAIQTAQITVDENGVQAATAFMPANGSAADTEAPALSFNRPFFFIITANSTGPAVPLYVGVVNNPLQ